MGTAAGAVLITFVIERFWTFRAMEERRFQLGLRVDLATLVRKPSSRTASAPAKLSITNKALAITQKKYARGLAGRA